MMLAPLRGGTVRMDAMVIDPGRQPLRPPPWRVFLSHTSDLRAHPEERSFVDAAEAAVVRAGHAVADMGYFAARDMRPADYCTAMVSEAHVYVGVIGASYGSTVRDRSELSYTELEFEAASVHGLPRLLFLVREDAASLPRARQPDEHAARQDGFRRRLRESGITIAWVASPLELELALLQALNDLGALSKAVWTTIAGELARGRADHQVWPPEAHRAPLRRPRSVVGAAGRTGRARRQSAGGVRSRDQLIPGRAWLGQARGVQPLSRLRGHAVSPSSGWGG